jgi:cysteine synthase A
MAGNTSLMAVKALAGKGVITESLIGGISELPQGKNRQLSELIREATD